MSDINKFIAIGRVANKNLNQAGSAFVMRFSVATNKKWTDKSGNLNEKAIFHKCELWGNRAQKLFDYIQIGQQVYIEGELDLNSWEGKDGEKKEQTIVRVSDIQLFGHSNKSEQHPF